MSMALHTSGSVAGRTGLPRWKLVYLIETGGLPGPSHQVPGRRLFTDEDVSAIERTLAARPDLRESCRTQSEPRK
jgi:DNA-binding transcriptional MerR regulator